MDGSAWMQIQTFSPNLDGGARGIFSLVLMIHSNNPKMVDFITIPTQGNATDFGDMTGNATFYGGGFSIIQEDFGGGTRWIVLIRLQFITFSSTGNAQDFGDLTGNSI